MHAWLKKRRKYIKKKKKIEVLRKCVERGEGLLAWGCAVSGAGPVTWQVGDHDYLLGIPPEKGERERERGWTYGGEIFSKPKISADDSLQMRGPLQASNVDRRTFPSLRNGVFGRNFINSNSVIKQSILRMFQVFS